MSNLISTIYRPRPVVDVIFETGSGAVVSTTDATSYTSGTSAIWGADELGVICVAATGTTATGSITSALGKTYTKIASLAYNSGVDTLYIFVSDSLYGGLAFGNSYGDTITFNCTGDQATGCIMSILRVSNMAKTGAAAVLQVATDTNSSGIPTPTFSSAVNTNNPTIGLMGNGTNPATMTPPTGWNEIRDAGYSVPTSGFENCRRFNGFSGTTVTWGSSSATPYGAIVIELDWS